MKIVLNQDVRGLGTTGQVKEVADGYARNYLIPRGLASPATPEALRRADARKAKDFKRGDEIRDLLLEKGIVLLDGPQGTTWKVK